MRSIWPLLQQLPTSFEHEGAKAQCLKDARQGLKLSDTHPGPHFMQPNCKIQQFLTPLSPSVYGRPLWIVPKHTIIIIIIPDSLGPTLFGRGGAGRQTDSVGHAIMTHSLTHSYRNLDMEEKTLLCVRRHHPSRYGFCALF